MNDTINKNTTVLFATFAVYVNRKALAANGMIEPMLSFFLPKVHTFTLLTQPHPSSDRISPIIKEYKGNSQEKEWTISPLWYLPLYLICKIQNNDNTHLSFKLRDFFSVLYCGFIVRNKYDLFIGLECVNASAGILLRSLGRVGRVIYYVSDYAPKRFANPVLNNIYLWLDKFCIERADFTWDVSPAMKEARLQAGILQEDSKKILHVPNGLFESQIDPLPIAKRIRHSIVYMGLLNPDQHGVDLALQAFVIVLKKYPAATFHVIGGTNRDSNPFMDMVRDLGIEKSVISYGFVPPNEEMSSVIQKCMVGVATYRSDRNPRNKYGDSGKIKQYLGCGLPIVATMIQWYTRYVIGQGAGVGAKETPEDFAKAILKLFENSAFYKRCSEKAIELSKGNTWDHVYGTALREMENVMNRK